MENPDRALTDAERPAGSVDRDGENLGRRPPIRVDLGVLCVLLLSVQLIPSLPKYLGLASSMAAGMVVAAGICIVTVAICWVIRARSSGRGLLDVGGGGLVVIGTIVVLILLHGIVADQHQRIATGRFVTSLIPLVFLLGGGLALGRTLKDGNPLQIDSVVWISFWVLCCIGALSIVGLQPLGSEFAKSTFPFTETSHFALAFGPILLYRCARTRPSRRTLWVVLLFLFAVALKSATLLAVAFIGAVICHRFLVVLLAVTLALIGGMSARLKYYTHRADISSSSSNISALVYLQGWEMLASSLARSDGWGIGFQQLGVRATEVGATEAIQNRTGGETLNAMDGSFVLSKLGSEFGVAGLLLVVAYCGLALRSLRMLRRGKTWPASDLARSIVVAYGIDMFVRGVGYFSESALLFIAAIFVLAPAQGLLAASMSPKRARLLVLR